MQFTKVHGLGNDFIVLDGRTNTLDYKALAPRLCHRQTGIGADGLLIIENSDKADIRMRIINGSLFYRPLAVQPTYTDCQSDA